MVNQQRHIAARMAYLSSFPVHDPQSARGRVDKQTVSGLGVGKGE
jgi:hypothetical protein